MVSPKFETELTLGSSVFDVAFLKEDVIITGGRDRTTRIWDMYSSSEIVPRTYHEGTVVRVAFATPDHLITSTRRVLRIWKSEEYKRIKSPFSVQQATFSGDGSRVLLVRKPSPQAPEHTNTTSRPAPPEQTSDSEMRPSLPASLNHMILDQQISMAVLSHDGELVFTASPTEGDGSAVGMDLRTWSAPDKSLGDLNRKLSELPLAAFSRSGNSWRSLEKRPGNRRLVCSCGILHLPKAALESPNRSAWIFPAEKDSLSIKKLAFGRCMERDVVAIVGQEENENGEERGIVFVGIVNDESRRRCSSTA
jgi:hypothetical protein